MMFCVMFWLLLVVVVELSVEVWFVIEEEADGTPVIIALEWDGVDGYKKVVIRFETSEEHQIAEGDMFDTVLDAFNTGLPEGWSIDDTIEPCRFVPGYTGPYVPYNRGNATSLVLPAAPGKEGGVSAEKHPQPPQ